MQSHDVVIVGRIGRPYGVRGWVRITSYTEPPGNLLAYEPWLIEDRERWRPIRPDTVESHGDGFVAQLAGVTDRSAAAGFAGRRLAVDRATLPRLDEGEYYWRDLEGLAVWRSGEMLGSVDHLIDTGAAPVLVVHGESGEILIPFAGEHVVDVSLAEGRIEVNWHEGD